MNLSIWSYPVLPPLLGRRMNITLSTKHLHKTSLLTEVVVAWKVRFPIHSYQAMRPCRCSKPAAKYQFFTNEFHGERITSSNKKPKLQNLFVTSLKSFNAVYWGGSASCESARVGTNLFLPRSSNSFRFECGAVVLPSRDFEFTTPKWMATLQYWYQRVPLTT